LKTNANLKKIIANIKETKKKIEKEERGRQPIVIPHPSEKYLKQRDMRQEAMDMGSHGASEYFGGQNDTGN